MSNYIKNINFKLYDFKNVILEPYRCTLFKNNNQNIDDYYFRFSLFSYNKFLHTLKTESVEPNDMIRTDFDDIHFVPTSFNYYHMMIDCLPRLNEYFTNNDKTILLNKNFVDVFPGLYDILNKYLKFKNIKFFNYEKPTNSISTNHRFFIKNLQLYASLNNDSLQANKDIKNLAVHFWQKYVQDIFTPIKPFRKIFINRSIKGDLQGQNSNARCGNQDEIFDELKKKDFELLDPNKIDLKTTIKMCFEAKEIIGVHGAGLSNILFTQPGVKFTQLVSRTNNNKIEKHKENHYKHISDILGLKYNVLYGFTKDGLKETDSLNKKELFYIKKEQLKVI
jgi:hypothetical protein